MRGLLMFRLGAELFAVDLAAVEEVVEGPAVHALPEMPPRMLGVLTLRGRMVPVYSPEYALGVPPRDDSPAVLVVRVAAGRVGLAVDDVEDVLTLGDAPGRSVPGIADPAEVLRGVVRHGAELVSLIDANALIASCAPGALGEEAA